MEFILQKDAKLDVDVTDDVKIIKDSSCPFKIIKGAVN